MTLTFLCSGYEFSHDIATTPTILCPGYEFSHDIATTLTLLCSGHELGYALMGIREFEEKQGKALSGMHREFMDR